MEAEKQVAEQPNSEPKPMDEKDPSPAKSEKMTEKTAVDDDVVEEGPSKRQKLSETEDKKVTKPQGNEEGK